MNPRAPSCSMPLCLLQQYSLDAFLTSPEVEGDRGQRLMRRRMRTAGVFVVLFALLLPTASPAFAESAEEMLPSCTPLVAARMSGDQADIPARSQRCWDAFDALQKTIVFSGESAKVIFGVCAPSGTK